MRVATHSGSFHADDVFALAALTLLVAAEPALGPLEIVRTRDPEQLAAADLRVDVGQRDDPATGDFDHHQRGGAGERPNGIRYASFGLVWREFGARVAGGEQAETIAQRLDEVLVQGVDANDTGQTISSPLVADVAPLTVSHAIAAFNPNWDEDGSAAAKRRAFDEALAFATGILARELASARAQVRAAELVRAAIARAEDPRLIELDQGLPWHRELVPTAPDALYVVYPREQDWGVQAVPRALGEFANRKDLPEAWAGRADAELAEVTGVPDARFCHAGRFMAVAGSREGALELARRALAHVD
jgi:uncharacterized UPF0160 family protein